MHQSGIDFGVLWRSCSVVDFQVQGWAVFAVRFLLHCLDSTGRLCLSMYLLCLGWPSYVCVSSDSVILLLAVSVVAQSLAVESFVTHMCSCVFYMSSYVLFLDHGCVLCTSQSY